jgi:hypothetical protein
MDSRSATKHRTWSIVGVEIKNVDVPKEPREHWTEDARQSNCE